MKISVICFTAKGYELQQKLKALFEKDGYEVENYCKCKALIDICKEEFVTIPIDKWAAIQFEKKNAIVVIGAAGIAVRAVAASVSNKLSDSPVIVMDEKGGFVIPLLSGHVGGANELALYIAKTAGATPVITTATDVNDVFAVDIFAKKNSMNILNKEGIAAVSSKVLAGKQITICYEAGFEPDMASYDRYIKTHPAEIRLCEASKTDTADVFITEKGLPEAQALKKALLYLQPKSYILGIGCRKGKEEEKIGELVLAGLAEKDIDTSQVRLITSIDVKKDEAGIKAFADKIGVPFVTYPAEELNLLEGEFNDSEFVRAQVGTGNVSERSAIAGCDGEGEIILPKQALNGVTVAIAKQKRRFGFE